MNFNDILKNKYIIAAAAVCVVGLFAMFTFNGNTAEGNITEVSESDNNQTHSVSDRERAQKEPLEVVVEATADADNTKEDVNTGENQ